MTRRVLQLGVAKLITPFGPGAIVDVLGESFIMMTAEHWPSRERLPSIDCLRLSSRLGVQRFYGPPVVEDSESPNALGITVARFPAWLFCQSCRRMVRWSPKLEAGEAPLCPSDSGQLVPMRFVVACRDKSHAADVPWADWVHRAATAPTCSESSHLRFRPVEGGAPGLSGLEVACDACGTRRSLGDLRADVLRKEGFKCHGTQPWEYEWRDCPSPLEVLQRGATSFHFGETEGAIDIPDVSASTKSPSEMVKTHQLYLALRAMFDEPLAHSLAVTIGNDLGMSPDQVVAITRHDLEASAESQSVRTAILSEEFEAFRAAEFDAADEENFKTRSDHFRTHADDPVEALLAGLIDSVILVDRLREVRACLGFTRYSPDAARVPAVGLAPTEASWLPAHEGFGEGVFLRFRAETIDKWANDPRTLKRAGALADRHADSSFAVKRLHAFSAQYVALHSLAHALVQELAFSSGYPAASLRERIYCEPELGEYGVFVYTTSSDNEGTLGGLVREGERERLGRTIARAIEQLSWCSNDPVCGESEPQNLDGLNLAACHACLLISETSCEGFNLLLDRELLVGNPSGDAESAGFLSPLVDAVSATAV